MSGKTESEDSREHAGHDPIRQATRGSSGTPLSPEPARSDFGGTLARTQAQGATRAVRALGTPASLCLHALHHATNQFTVVNKKNPNFDDYGDWGERGPGDGQIERCPSRQVSRDQDMPWDIRGGIDRRDATRPRAGCKSMSACLTHVGVTCGHRRYSSRRYLLKCSRVGLSTIKTRNFDDRAVASIAFDCGDLAEPFAGAGVGTPPLLKIGRAPPRGRGGTPTPES